MPNLLVVDDNKLILDCFRHAFSSDQVHVQTATSPHEAVSAFSQEAFDAVITDINLPDSSGLQLLQELHAINSSIPIIVMTGHGDARSAIEAMRKGAFEYLLKPLDPVELHAVVNRAFEASQVSRNRNEKPEASGTETEDNDALIGRCPAMQEVYCQIGRVAGQDITVLILGESGTGKEVVARAIYQYSKRADKQFLAINCAAIPESLLESELFGHEKGSFTGAETKRNGKFEQCDGGTLFLDEIGDMSPLTQTKVLRVLQDQQFERVGGNQTVRTNVRLIAATSRDLPTMMEQGAFRSDLFYRLNIYTIQIPPLRERIGDLPLLINHFLARFSRELGKPVLDVSLAAMDLLTQYQWPGNIRELQSVLKHAVIEASGSVILPEFLPETIRRPAVHCQAKLPKLTTSDQDLLKLVQERIRNVKEDLYDDVINRVEKVLLTELLRQLDTNVSRASKILGLSRSTLRVKLAAMGINIDRTVCVTK